MNYSALIVLVYIKKLNFFNLIEELTFSDDIFKLTVDSKMYEIR
jgi:hypothetical protein